MTLKSTNLAKTLPKNCTETSRKPFDSSTENMDLPDYIGGAKVLQQIAPHRNTSPVPRFYGLPKFTRLIAPCDP